MRKKISDCRDNAYYKMFKEQQEARIKKASAEAKRDMLESQKVVDAAMHKYDIEKLDLNKKLDKKLLEYDRAHYKNQIKSLGAKSKTLKAEADYNIEELEQGARVDKARTP